MARSAGAWVEYERETPDSSPKIIRVFSSEIPTWRSAGPNGNLAIFIEFGSTLAEALAKVDPSKTTPKKATGADVGQVAKA